MIDLFNCSQVGLEILLSRLTVCCCLPMFISNVMYTGDIEALFVLVHVVNTHAASWNLSNYYLTLAWIGRFTHIIAFHL